MHEGKKLWNDYVTLDAYFQLLDTRPDLLDQANASVQSGFDNNSADFRSAFPAIARRTEFAIGIVKGLKERLSNPEGKSPELFAYLYPTGYSHGKGIISQSQVTTDIRGFSIEFTVKDWNHDGSAGFHPRSDRYLDDVIQPEEVIEAIDNHEPGTPFDVMSWRMRNEPTRYVTFQSDLTYKAAILQQNNVEVTKKNVYAYHEAVRLHEWRHVVDELVRAGYKKKTTVEMQTELMWNPYPLLHYSFDKKLERDQNAQLANMAFGEHFREAIELVLEDMDDSVVAQKRLLAQQAKNLNRRKLFSLMVSTEMTKGICRELPVHVQRPLSYLFSTTDIMDLPRKIATVQPYIQ